ncbi:MAG: peptide chain release factor N(5)-glutamine methyltransferase [Acidimicrobiia bacterium]|nr:peptide chain release factor N(5)-glutamine methyltransferase [Acidimicrobiia bacterium]
MVTASELIRHAGLERHEAERLLVIATGRSRAELVTKGDMAADASARFRELVAQRLAGVPLQYLEGTVQFGPLELSVDRRALIPRPETEQLWERVVELAASEPPEFVVDLCTGSGNLALAMKHAYSDADVYGTDQSSDALSLAAANAATTSLDVNWLEGDLFDALPDSLRGRIDLLVSNPPYIAAGDYDGLPVDVRDHEPIDALIAGPHGDEALVRIAAEAEEWLSPGGLIACEIGADQGRRAAELFAAFSPTVERDLAGRDRYVFGRSQVG